jgi:hypothetical protein
MKIVSRGTISMVWASAWDLSVSRLERAVDVVMLCFLRCSDTPSAMM